MAVAVVIERQEIFPRRLPLADNIARNPRGRGVDDEDLRQVAYLGSVGAVDRFDHTNGTSFLSFAIPTIMGEVRRHFRHQSRAVPVPRATKGDPRQGWMTPLAIQPTSRRGA